MKQLNRFCFYTFLAFFFGATAQQRTVGALDRPILSLDQDTPALPGQPDNFEPDESNTLQWAAARGYVLSDYFWDTRQVVGSRQDHFYFFPENKLPDENGCDINSRGQFHFIPVQTRGQVKIFGPDVFDAKASALMEVDFRGRDELSVNLVRMRHAFCLLEWEHTSLLFGQFWNPMFTLESFADPLMFGAGLPFEPFARNPQVRLRYDFGGLQMILAALSQVDFKSLGDLGDSTTYIRNSLIPTFHLQFQVPTERHVFGVGAEIKTIRPRLVTDLNFVEDERLTSVAGMAFFKLNFEPFWVRAKLTVGQNLADLLMLGGYGIETVDPRTDRRTYTNVRTAAFWTELVYEATAHLEPAVFFGFSKNLGAGACLADLCCFPCFDQRAECPEDGCVCVPRIKSFGDELFVFGPDIDWMLRVSPRIYWNRDPWRFSAELIYDRTNYGTPDQRGKVINAHAVSNFRFIFAAQYFFAY